MCLNAVKVTSVKIYIFRTLYLQSLSEAYIKEFASLVNDKSILRDPAVKYDLPDLQKGIEALLLAKKVIKQFGEQGQLFKDERPITYKYLHNLEKALEKKVINAYRKATKENVFNPFLDNEELITIELYVGSHLIRNTARIISLDIKFTATELF